MNRTPLTRKTPLKRGSSELKTKTFLRQKVPLRKRSEKMSEIYRTQRIPLVIEMLEESPWCSARLKHCTRRATDVHEVKSRARGGSITDKDNCITLCRHCHTFITEHPRWAKEHGWSKSSWDE